jgi:hypothetical protein
MDFISVVASILAIVAMVIAMIVLKDVFGEFYCQCKQHTEQMDGVENAKRSILHDMPKTNDRE